MASADIVTSLGQLLHQSVCADLDGNGFGNVTKDDCKIRLLYECQRCFKTLSSWGEFLKHLQDHNGKLLGHNPNQEHVLKDNIVEKPNFPLPPKKNKLARTEVNEERSRPRRSKAGVKEEFSKDVVAENSEVNSIRIVEQSVTKKKRGRPPKRKLEQVEPPDSIHNHSNDTAKIPTTKGKSQINAMQHGSSQSIGQSKRLIFIHVEKDCSNEPVEATSELQNANECQGQSNDKSGKNIKDLNSESQKQNNQSNNDTAGCEGVDGLSNISDTKLNTNNLGATNFKHADVITDDVTVTAEHKAKTKQTKSLEIKEVDVNNTNNTGLNAVDAEMTDLNILSETQLESGENDSLVKSDNPDSNDSNVAPEEYFMSRDQKEDLKARTCPFCHEVLESIADCLPHYKQKHDFTPKAFIVVTPQEFIPDTRTKRQKGPDTCGQCPYCGKFFLKEKLQRHVILVHVWRSVQRNSKRKKPSLCDICGQEFSYAHNMVAHRKSHFQEQPEVGKPKRSTHYVCQICNYSTPERQRLLFHTLSEHDNKKVFKCSHTDCTYETWERSSFRCHLYKHSSEKQFKCSYCSYQCIQLKQLRNHLLRQHMITLPKKYEVAVDDKGKRTVKIVAPREKPQITTKAKTVALPSTDITEVPLISQMDHVVPNDQNMDLQNAQQQQQSQHLIAKNEYVTIAGTQAEQGTNQIAQIVTQDGRLCQAVREEFSTLNGGEIHATIHDGVNSEIHAEINRDVHEPTGHKQQEYYQEQVISEDQTAPYMLLYQSELGENTYTPVPQAVAEVLVTTNIGEQQVQLHLCPPMSKSGEVQSNNLTPEQVHAANGSQVAIETATDVTMATMQEVSIATSSHLGVTTQELHPTSQVKYVSVMNESDVMSACTNQPLMEGSVHQHPQMAVPTPSSHLVVDSNQQSMNFVNDSQAVVIHETVQSTTILQNDNFSYAPSAQLIDNGNSFEVPNNSQNIELTQVPILTYSELQTSSEIEEPKNVECVPAGNSSVEEDIARTLIQINDNH